MRLSTSTNLLSSDKGKSRSFSFEDSIRGCAEAGYRYLDANLCMLCREGQPLTGVRWKEKIESARQLADSFEVRFTQAHAYFPIGKKFDAQGSRTDGDYGEELMRRCVLSAQLLGVKWMIVHPLSVESESGYSYLKSYIYNREYLNRWADYFADHQVNMAIENMSLFKGRMHYCCTAEELLELVDVIDNSHVGICVDTGHAHLARLRVPELLRAVAGKLHATHIADNHQNEDEHIAPFSGTIDWTAVVRTLKDIGYQDDFSFEIQNFTACCPKEIQQELVNFSYRLGCRLLELS